MNQLLYLGVEGWIDKIDAWGWMAWNKTDEISLEYTKPELPMNKRSCPSSC